MNSAERRAEQHRLKRAAKHVARYIAPGVAVPANGSLDQAALDAHLAKQIVATALDRLRQGILSPPVSGRIPDLRLARELERSGVLTDRGDLRPPLRQRSSTFEIARRMADTTPPAPAQVRDGQPAEDRDGPCPETPTPT